jgi:putative effector of murein hydrolase
MLGGEGYCGSDMGWRQRERNYKAAHVRVSVVIWIWQKTLFRRFRSCWSMAQQVSYVLGIAVLSCAAYILYSLYNFGSRDKRYAQNI